MPNNKNQNRNGGSAQGAREQLQDVGQQFQEGAEQAANRLREGYDTAREGAVQGYRQAEGLAARNPGPSLLLGFGVGFGLGVVLVSLFAREETWAEKYLPEQLQDLPDRYQRLASSLKSSTNDAIHDAPDRYQSLLSSLRSLPKQVHDYLPSSIAKHLG
jgi:ElaB/YqjD/DUF883 family membrane-anchored ribosome-binding protein